MEFEKRNWEIDQATAAIRSRARSLYRLDENRHLVWG